MMLDYSEILARIEEGLGRRFRESRGILNVPGASLACKVDVFHYLALRPGFTAHAAKWAGTLPKNAEESLIRTGNMIVGQGRVRYPDAIAVFEEGSDRIMRVHADFILAACIDHSLAMYGGEPEPLPVSPLRIHISEREKLDAFFNGKTRLQSLAFGEPG